LRHSSKSDVVYSQHPSLLSRVIASCSLATTFTCNSHNLTTQHSMSSKLVPADPAKVMVIRDVVPRAITTLSVPFWRFGRVKVGGRGTIGMHAMFLKSNNSTNIYRSAPPVWRSRCLLPCCPDRRRQIQSLRAGRSKVHRRARCRSTSSIIYTIHID
jgi:hypothetical protein